MHCALQLQGQCRFRAFRVPEELALDQAIKKRDRESGEHVLEDLRMRDLQTGLPLPLQDQQVQGLQASGRSASRVVRANRSLSCYGVTAS